MDPVSKCVWKSVRRWWNGTTEVRRALRNGGGRYMLAACVEPLERRELPAATTPVFGVPANPDPLRSQGPQSTLVVRVDLTDRDLQGLLGDLQSIKTLTDERIRDAYAEVNEFYTRQSFGKLTFPDDKLTIVPGRMNLPFSVSELEKSSKGPDQIIKAVEKKLRDKGYKLSDYLHITIIHPYLDGKNFDYAGLGYLSGDRLLLNANIIPEVWAHELGHNAGAPHVGVFDPKDPAAVVGDAKQMKFLDQESTGLDLMESSDELVGINNNGDMFALRKTQFGWLDVGTNVVNVTQSSQYRLFAIDSGTEQDDRVYALRIRRNNTQEYWLEYRESHGEGVTVTVYNYGGDKKLGLLDMTPESSSLESTLDVGSIFDDLNAKIHVNPLQTDDLNGAHFIDVQVTIGDDPANHAPTATLAVSNSTPYADELVQLTAAISDLDNDVPRIHWDFGDGTTEIGTLTPTHAWAPGAYLVRLKVNDGRGGMAEYVKAVTVTDREPIGIVSRPQLDRTANQTKDDGGNADVASDGDNRFVVVWYSSTTQLVMGRRFEGTDPVGSEFVIDEAFFLLDGRPAVAMDHDGNFVVAWKALTSANSTTAVIRVKKFNAWGEPLSDERVVASAEVGSLSNPNIAVASDTGEFIVAWSLRAANPGALYGTVQYQRFDAQGSPLSEVGQLATDPMLQKTRHACPAVAMQPTGESVIAVASTGRHIYVQRFDRQGAAQGMLATVNRSQQNNAIVTIDKIDATFASDGGLAVVFGGLRYPSQDYGTLVNLSPDATVVGPEIRMGGYDPSVAIDQNGNRFMTVVKPMLNRGDQVVGKLYSAEGEPISQDVERPHPSVGSHDTVSTSTAYLNSASSFVVASEEHHSGPKADTTTTGTTIKFFENSDAIRTESDFASAAVNQKVSVFVTENDMNPASGALKLSLPIAPGFGTVSVNPNGTPTDYADDVVTYTPRTGFQGTDEIVYQVTNEQGVTAYGVLRVQVGAPSSGSADVAANSVQGIPNLYSLKEDAVLKVGGAGVLTNDAIVNRGKLTAELVGGTTHGTLTFKPNGTFVYQPAANFSGTDSFTYRVSNGLTVSQPTTVTLFVQPVVDKPKLTVPKTLLGLVGVPVSLPIVFGTADTDGSETLTLKLSGLPATAMLNHGVRLADGTWRLRADDLPGLTITVFGPGSFNLKVDCTVGEALGSALTKASASLRITVSETAAA